MSQNSFPTKTKIASVLLIINGGLFFFGFFWVIKNLHWGWWYLSNFYSILIFLFLPLFFSFLFIFFPLFLLKKKRWGWWGSIGSLIFLILLILCKLISYYLGFVLWPGIFTEVIKFILPLFPIYLLILAFLLLDKKAVWRICPPLQLPQIKKIKTKILVSFLIIAFLLVGGWGVWKISQPKGEVIITIDKNEYEVGETVKITVKNNTNKTVWYSEFLDCWWTLRKASGEEISVSLPKDEKGTIVIGFGKSKILEPDSEIIYLWDFKKSGDGFITFLEPGIYKFSFDYGFSKWYLADKIAYSRNFEMKEEWKSVPNVNLSEEWTINIAKKAGEVKRFLEFYPNAKLSTIKLKCRDYEDGNCKESSFIKKPFAPKFWLVDYFIDDYLSSSDSVRIVVDAQTGEIVEKFCRINSRECIIGLEETKEGFKISEWPLYKNEEFRLEIKYPELLFVKTEERKEKKELSVNFCLSSKAWPEGYSKELTLDIRPKPEIEPLQFWIIKQYNLPKDFPFVEIEANNDIRALKPEEIAEDYYLKHYKDPIWKSSDYKELIMNYWFVENQNYVFSLRHWKYSRKDSILEYDTLSKIADQILSAFRFLE